MNVVSPWESVQILKLSGYAKYLWIRRNFKTKKIKADVCPTNSRHTEFRYTINTPQGKQISAVCKTLDQAKDSVDNWLRENGWRLLDEDNTLTLLI